MNHNSSSSFEWNRFSQVPVIGIVRGLSEEMIMNLAKIYEEEGFYALEVTMNTENAAHIISRLNSEFPQLCIGAGTVCNLEDLAEALTAGSQFIVTPIMSVEIIRKCVESGIPVFPGAFTPTEIHTAWSNGASAVKVFPSGFLGPGYIKNILAPLNDIKLIPTGGVSEKNILEYLEVGACGVGMGSSLFPKALKDGAEIDNYRSQLKNIKGILEENKVS